MDILIIGGTRFVGHFTALALHEAGHRVSVFTRGRHKFELPDGIGHFKGDRKDEADLTAVASAREWDVVWDNMSYTGDDARAAVRAFRDRTGLFIHTSTLAVYSVCEGIVSPYREEDFERGRPLTERLGIYPYDYGIARREGELALQDAHAEFGFPFVTIRLPAVLDDRRLILPDNGIEMHRTVYSGDVVQALLAIVERGAELAGRAYNLGGREIVSLRGFVEDSARILNTDVEIVDVPRSVIAKAGIDPDGLSPYTTWGNHIQAIARAQHELDFKPTPMEEWLPTTIAWHLEHRRDAEPPGWELREREAQLAERWLAFFSGLG
jgi:nucleoside-diphosphate-sugar epimerase